MPILSHKRPLNRWDHSSIQPGAVGSVGDVNTQVRFAQSAPDMPMRYDPTFSGSNEPWAGSNVTDGMQLGYDGGGGAARVEDSNWGMRRDFYHQYGYLYQDLRPSDRSDEPILEQLPQYGWKNQVATIYNAFTTGDKFLPLPGGYELGGSTSRGGAYPRIVDISDDTGVIVGGQQFNAGVVPQPGKNPNIVDSHVYNDVTMNPLTPATSAMSDVRFTGRGSPTVAGRLKRGDAPRSR